MTRASAPCHICIQNTDQQNSLYLSGFRPDTERTKRALKIKRISTPHYFHYYVQIYAVDKNKKEHENKHMF